MPTIQEILHTAWQDHQRGDLVNAERLYRQVVEAAPQEAAAWHQLGLLCRQTERHEEAVEHFRRVISLAPGFAQVQFNLGNALLHLGRPEEAAASFRATIALTPDDAEVHNNLAVVLNQLGRYEEAAASCQQAIRIRPDYFAAHHNLGSALQGQDLLDEAAASYRKTLELKPDYANAHHKLGDVLAKLGRLDEAIVHHQGGLRIRPSARRRIQLATLLPEIYQSAEEVQHWRRKFSDNVEQLHGEGIIQDLTQERGTPPFYLAYQGLDDCRLQHSIARLYRAPQEPELRPRSTPDVPNEKIRVGFVSRYLRNHTVGELMQGAIARLSREKFHVTVLAIEPREEILAYHIRQSADHYEEVPEALPAARELLRRQQFDVLFYPDVGMDPLTYSLAFSRLAPVQCVTWGHPVTTGIDTIDYFISSEHLEPPEADEHYTETLIRLTDPPTCYYRPVPPEPLNGRDYFGLPEDSHVYACPQSLFKFHPEFDPTLGDILRRDRHGILLLIIGISRCRKEQLMARFSRTLSDVVDRIRFVPRQDRDDFLNLLAQSDVMLDPFYFGGGNTSYQGLGLGVPIVTMPSEFLRGRVTYALYRQMEILDCVVNDPAEYVEVALRLGTDRQYRNEVSGRILKSNHVLFENARFIGELEQFLIRAVTGAGR